MADEGRPPPSSTPDDVPSRTAPLSRISSASGSASDRIFPISSAVGIDPQRSQSPSGRSFSINYVPPGSLPEDESVQNIGTDATGLAGTHASTPENEKTRETPQPDPGGDRISTRGGSPSGLTASRFKHVDTPDGHYIITGLDDGPLKRCEDEPIHIPGAVQGFGLLVALQEKDKDQLVVRVVSENSQRIIGYTPEQLFTLDNFCDILTEEQQDNLLDHIDFIRDEETDPASNGPDVFMMSIVSKDSSRANCKLWCAMHINPVHSDLIICEFELDEDETYPLVPSSGTLEVPEDTLDCDPTDEEYIESTFNTSKPLRVLRSARRRRGEAAAMEAYNTMSQVQDQLASAPNLDRFLKILVGVVKELTGFHRVMIYQFDSNFHGRVVTELVDPRATKDLYRGLHFPASDIPKQARDLYKINKVRLLYDRDLTTARLVCRSAEDLKRPLDLTFSYLRAMSPIHLKYLANMAVRSSMSISINAFNELWGLISCHSYGSRGMRVSFPIRNMCRLIGDTASRNIERLSYASRLQARKLINTTPTEAHPSGYILVSSEDLLDLFDADFGLLTIRNETKILGHLEHSQEALAMVEYLRVRKFTSVLSTQNIKEDFSDIQYPPGFSIIAGLLLVPLNVTGDDFIVFFRRSYTREVKWAGNPYEKIMSSNIETRLEPRSSFKMWSETVSGQCSEWTEEQIETAAVLCLVYGKFIKVWRERATALESSDLKKLLISNSAHEVRTPLNAIINYLEIALEGTLDQETRDCLSKSHSASKSLIYVINDLLDLTKTEEGQELINDERFDLLATVREATDTFKEEATRKGLLYDLVEHPGLPQWVYGDQRRIRQAISNVIANAVDNTTVGHVCIELWLGNVTEEETTVEVVVQDSGSGISSKHLDRLFKDLEQVTSDESECLASTESLNQLLAKRNRDRVLGLGLAVVARTIQNMNGQLRLTSEEGHGSRFIIQFPFSLAGKEKDPKISGAGYPVPQRPVTPNEITLIDKTCRGVGGNLRKYDGHIKGGSQSSRSGSSSSLKSNKSDIDRLIEEFSEPTGKLKAELPLRHKSLPAQVSRSPNLSQDGLPGGEPSSARLDSAPVIPGYTAIPGEKTLLRAVRMPEESPSGQASESPRQVNFSDVSDLVESSHAQSQAIKPLDTEHLRILVAEDDLVNSRIIKKRLEKSGHEVHMTVNGQECATTYQEKEAFFDVVLMDMQMPIVDGATATGIIRSFEKDHIETCLSDRALANRRVPVFAVSASLIERDRKKYIGAGFDGWILKPIDFKRLNVLFRGIVDDEARDSCQYRPGGWEDGGWFESRLHREIPSHPGM